MSLLAAATRTRLQDPNTNPRKNVKGGLVVPLTLRFKTATTQDVVRQAIRYAFGEPHFFLGNRVAGGVGSASVGGASKSLERMIGEAVLLGDAGLTADEVNWTQNPSNFVRNPNLRDDASGFTAVGGTVVRSTAQSLIGPASALITTAGSAQQGAYYQGTRLTKGATQTYRFWAFHRTDDGDTGNVRAYLAEYESDGTTIVGTKTTGGAAAVSTTWTISTGTRASVPAGRILRVGLEKTGAVTESFHGAAFGAAPSAQGGDLTVSNVIQAGTVMHLPLRFVGMDFDPLALYDGFDAVFTTVESDRDDLANGTYNFALTL